MHRQQTHTITSIPTISVIVPCYRKDTYLPRTLESLLRSTLSKWEAVIVDDGSPDRCAEIATVYASRDARIRVVRRTNGGPTVARNTGVAHANPRSQYLLFLDADDVVDPSMLHEMVDVLDRVKAAGLAFCRARLIDEHDRLITPVAYADSNICRHAPRRLGFHRLGDDEPITPFTSMFAWWPGCLPSGTVLKRSVYELTPRWDQSFGNCGEDWDLFLNLALHADCVFVPRVLVSYRQTSDQLSAVSDLFGPGSKAV